MRSRYTTVIVPAVHFLFSTPRLPTPSLPYVEQGFFRERRWQWKKLPGGFNVQARFLQPTSYFLLPASYSLPSYVLLFNAQAGLLKRRWKLNVRGPVDVKTSDFFLHKKFFELPAPVLKLTSPHQSAIHVISSHPCMQSQPYLPCLPQVQRRMGLRDCSGDPKLAVGRCYMVANAR